MSANQSPGGEPLPAEMLVTETRGRQITIAGEIPAEIFLPAEGGPWPAIVLGAEAYGPNHATRSLGAALAQRGFAALLPDYYRGRGPTDVENYTDFTEVMEAIAALDFRQAFVDVSATVDHATRLAEVDPSRIGVWGYCTGGTMAMVTAAINSHVRAAVVFFPSQPWFDELDDRHPVHPMDLLWAIRCPVMVQCGTEDAIMTADRLAELERRLALRGLEFSIDVHEGAGHAFNAPTPPLRDDRADRASWPAALEFMERHLSAVR